MYQGTLLALYCCKGSAVAVAVVLVVAVATKSNTATVYSNSCSCSSTQLTQNTATMHYTPENLLLLVWSHHKRKENKQKCDDLYAELFS